MQIVVFALLQLLEYREPKRTGPLHFQRNYQLSGSYDLVHEFDLYIYESAYLQTQVIDSQEHNSHII